MWYSSKRGSQAISSESRKPAVVTSAVRAPLRSIKALVASVVPWTTSPTVDGGHLACARMVRTPSITPRSGASGVVRTFMAWALSSISRTTSVNVPPISTAKRAVISVFVDLDVALGDDVAPGLVVALQEGDVFPTRHRRGVQAGFVVLRLHRRIRHHLQDGVGQHRHDRFGRLG